MKVTQGEQTEELRLSLLHLVTEIIASARKVGIPIAHTYQHACASKEFVCRCSLFACKLHTFANGNIAHQTAGLCLFITVPSAAVGSHMICILSSTTVSLLWHLICLSLLIHIEALTSIERDRSDVDRLISTSCRLLHHMEDRSLRFFSNVVMIATMKSACKPAAASRNW